MVDAKRKKETICATVSPYTKKKVDELVESGEFSSMSDLVSVAITEFLTKYLAEKQQSGRIVHESQKEENEKIRTKIQTIKKEDENGEEYKEMIFK
jgi:Arc/MetJ-type ribon-helix-helix transcriptional regulator